jgi:hypothetical protein
VQTSVSQLSSLFDQGFVIVFCLKAGHHFTIGLEFHQMETRRLSAKHQSKVNIRGHVTKLLQELIEGFAMTQMQTRLKPYQLKVSNMFKIPLPLVCNISWLKRNQS